jgi:CheY-like chemotaxis protein
MEARSGNEAAWMLRDGAQVDLMFTDVRMPGALDGIGLGRFIHNPPTRTLPISRPNE